MLHTIACARCGKPHTYEKVRKNRRYCPPCAAVREDELTAAARRAGRYREYARAYYRNRRYDRRCECGRDFQSRSPHAKFCRECLEAPRPSKPKPKPRCLLSSQLRCRRKSKPSIIYRCRCGAEVQRPRHFCSDRCRRECHREKWRDRSRRQRHTQLISRICPEDGNAFTARGHRNRFCSRDCAQKVAARIARARRRARERGEAINPIARGGAHTLDNVQCLCRDCNAWKADRILSEDEISQRRREKKYAYATHALTSL